MNINYLGWIISDIKQKGMEFACYFAKVFIDTQSSIRFSKTKGFDYLPQVNIESFFITLTGSSEVFNSISSLKLDYKKYLH